MTNLSWFAARLRDRFDNRARPDWHHLACSLGLIGTARVLMDYALALRDAAQRGDPEVRAARAAVREFFHCRHAVSILEHMVSGFGIALVGMAVLQMWYFAQSDARDITPNRKSSERKPISAPAQWSITAVAAGAAACLVAQCAYRGTTPAIALATLICVPLVLVYHARLDLLAVWAPERFIALASAPIWLNYELGWKVSQWRTTHDSASVIAAQLVGSLLVLLATSAAAGGLVRRIRWLALSSRSRAAHGHVSDARRS
ncbi:hypothetical protein [Burkholderia gladioli]|uniref:hypothetical protein n=1 Tax=Burkholderia gladioli TaxID=28095 RepID=UPI001641116B|nr:hypothetical protein [Burkholderia gladioli]MBJ9677923.1 hypothetical protein [Burkholderia gladioli]